MKSSSKIKRNSFSDRAEYDLRQLSSRRASVNFIADRLCILELENKSPSPSPKIADEISALSYRLNLQLKFISLTEAVIKLLPQNERTILSYFIDGRHIEEIADDIGCERAAAYRLKNVALEHFAALMYGADPYPGKAALPKDSNVTA